MTDDKKRGLVLDWLQEIIDNPEDWRTCYSDSEIKTLAEYTMGFLCTQRTIPSKKEYHQQAGAIFNIGHIDRLDL